MGRVFQSTLSRFLFFKFFLEFAFAAGFFGTTSLFIHRVGPFSLFYIYLGSSLLSLALSFLFARIIDKYSRRLIFIGSYLFLGALVVLGWALVHFFPEWKVLYFALRIFCYSIMVLMGLEFWIMASLTFTHDDSKKVFSQLVVVTILGDMAGGLFTGFASKWIGTENLLLGWGLLLCAIPFLFIRFPFPRPETPGFSTGVIWGEVQAPGTGYRSRSFFSSPLIKLLFIFWVAYSFICYGTDYAFNSFAAEKILGEDALTQFLGYVSAAASAGILCYHLFIAPTVTRRLGPTQNLFLACTIMVLPWILFSIHPSLITIAIADGVIFYFSDHFATGIHSAILTVFPERVKGRIRVVTEGYGMPVGTILLFGVAAIYSFHMSIEQIQYWMLITSLLFCTFPLWFRKPYHQHILNCLHSRDPSLVLNSVQALGESPHNDAIEPLAYLLKESKNIRLRRSVVHALEHMNSPEAMEKVLPILADPENPLHESAIDGLRYCPDYRGIYTLLGLLVRDREKDDYQRSQAFQVLKDLLGKGVIVFLLGRLYDEDPNVRAVALRALASFKDRSLISIFLPQLKNPHPRIRAGACIALYPFGRSRENVRAMALSEIQGLVGSEEMAERLAGLEAVGAVRLRSYQGLLKDSLTAPDKAVVLGAAAALAQYRDPAFLQPFLSLLANEDELTAIEAGKKITDFPMRSRGMLFTLIRSLPEAQQLKIWNRIKKTRQDYSLEWGLEGEKETYFPAHTHA